LKKGVDEDWKLKAQAKVKMGKVRPWLNLDLDFSLLVRGAGWLLAEPGCVLEDALRAGVVDELLAADETLLHRHLAPGAETIGEVG
jgi:hypothetical protein